jgi:hypothetical protein
LIAVWTDKAKWLFWRPITAIHDASADGNLATAPDAAWQPFLATPPYPDHPSGHVPLATAVTRTAARFFGTDKISFSATNHCCTCRDDHPRQPHRHRHATFTSLSRRGREVIRRAFSGIHFRNAGTGRGEDRQTITTSTATCSSPLRTAKTAD